MASLSVKRSITKFENTENSCPKMKLYFKKSVLRGVLKELKFLIQWQLAPKLSLGAAAIVLRVMVSSGNNSNSDCDLNLCLEWIE